MKRIVILIFFSSFLLGFSCNNGEECKNKILEIKSLEDLYGCENTKYQMNVDLSDNFIIIRSQNQFDNYVTGLCTPEIDFNTYDLIIGKQGLTTGNSYISYELVEDCETTNLLLTVTFHQNETLEAPDLTYHALVSKLGDDQVVNIDIEIK
jgi:hypothetical protein